MKCLRWLFLLQFAATLAFGQAAQQNQSHNSIDRPEAVVRSLYTKVVTLHPVGIPQGAEMKNLSPYLSKALLHKIHLFEACYAEWLRQNPDPNTKHPFGVFESGLFSGADDRSEVQAFEIEKGESLKDGSLRVYVKLTNDDPPGHPQTWRVAVIVIRENRHYVISDVIYLQDKNIPIESSLSELSKQCNGACWVGNNNQRSGLNQE